MAQFLNDTTECFTCEDRKCATGSVVGTFDRSTYRPYAENPNGPIENEILVAADAFYKTYKRPILASAVQLNTFDVMAGLIGLQQSANVVLQTIAKTTRSPGTALYGISNLGAPVRSYIETKLANIGAKSYSPQPTPMEQDEEDAKPTGEDSAMEPSEEGDEDGGNEKEVDKSSLQLTEVDIDLISVVRKAPAIITDVRAMIIFLNQNGLAGSALHETLQKPYNKLASETYEPEVSKQWIFTLRMLYDFLFYYRHIRPEEALARAKVITYIMKLLESLTGPRTANTNSSTVKEILALFVKTVDTFKGNTSDIKPKLNIIFTPLFHGQYTRMLRKIVNTIKNSSNPFEAIAFNEINDLIQKPSGDKKIDEAINGSNSLQNNYQKYTKQWMAMFEKVNEQNEEIEAAEARMNEAGLADSSPESEDSELYEDEEESETLTPESPTPESPILLNLLTPESPTPEPVRKRPKLSGGSRRHRKRLPKHRTLRKHSGGQKTLTQVLKELTLGI